ncbi:polynucleotide phosphorylase [Desulfovibrionales bacterium]
MNSAFDITRLTTQLEDKEIIIETGRLANQADGAAWIQCGGTVVLVTTVTQPREFDKGFFPLVVDYVEKMYAAGRVPGSFFRREIGRPSERETLCSRLIDRPIRPLFPNGFCDEVQIIATVLSADQENDPDVLALTGASTALHISHIPFLGPIAGARIGFVNGQFIINPTVKELTDSTLDLVMAASRAAVVMVEGSAKYIPHERLAEALAWGHKQIQPLLDLQEQLRDKVGTPKIKVVPPVEDTELQESVRALAEQPLTEAIFITDKMTRKSARKAVFLTLKEQLMDDLRFAVPVLGTPGVTAMDVAKAEARIKYIPEIFAALEKKIVRKRIKEQGIRIDGRNLATVRPIKIDVGILPRTHGSALFARGETKTLCVATLGSGSDEQRIETLMGDENKRFMLHYNFPPYCVGEIKMMRLSRREIGHGVLAERAIAQVLPDTESFPFTLRIVSEIMESNGSSSMASVCGASLALMDAGVPIKAPVAGIAMGLIKEEDDYLVLTDILGDEDALGDMDFKIAGTAEGVTAFQMDIKVAGIPTEVITHALAQAGDARMYILNEMNKILAAPRPELSPYAPQLAIVQVNPDVIRMVIGPGGKNIKAITTETGAAIDIDDLGKVRIFAPNTEALKRARAMVMYYDQRPESGKTYTGPVKKIIDGTGVLVEILPGVEGLVHISQLDLKRVEKVTDVAKLGDTLTIKCLEVLESGKMRLSRAAILAEQQGIEFNDPGRKPRSDRHSRDRDHRHDSSERF